MTKIIAVANQKGGVGKTTTTRNLVSLLYVLLQQRKAKQQAIVAIDLDPQGHLTLSYQIDTTGLKHMYHVFIEDDLLVGQVLLKAVSADIYVGPTNIDLAGTELDLDPRADYGILKQKMEHLIGQVAFILIDCPPSLNILTINAFVAADSVLVPCQTHYLAYHGLTLLNRSMELVRNSYNPGLELLGVLPTLYDARAAHDREILAEMRDNYPIIGEIPIPRRTAVADAMPAGQSIDEFSPRSDATKAYRSVAEQILRRYEEE
jgi:chromosome partitioning protein